MSTQVTKAVALDSLGRFSFDFEMDSPHEVFIHFGDNGEQFYVIPGHSITLGVEINRINKAETTDDTYTRPKMLFMGEDALLNTGFNDFNYRLKQIINSRNDDENQKRLDPVAYKAYRLEVMRQMQDTLADYSKRHNPEIMFRQYFEQNIKYQATNDLLRYGWTNGRKKLMPDYFDFFTAADFENELGPLTAEYIYTLYELSVIPYDSVDPLTSPSIEDVITLAKESDYKFTPEQEEFAKKNIIFKVKGPDTLAYISNADSASNSNHNAIFEGLWEGGHKAVDLQKEKRRKQLFERIGLTDNTLGIDIIHATAAYGKINNKKGISIADFEKYSKTIKNQEFINELTTRNEDYQSKNKDGLSARMHVIDPIAQTQDKLLETLAQKYKGKVVYVDFWAPWCGPCMGEMPASESMRKEFAGKNVVFLFLGVDCEKESWTKTIKSERIEGEHYLLSKDEFTLLKSKFQILGIPRYMIITYL